MVNPNDILIWAVLVAFAAGALIAWLLTRARAHAAGRASRDVEVTQLAAERDASLDARLRAQHDIDAALGELKEYRARLVATSSERATLEGRLERLAQVENELAVARTEAMKWREACQRAEQRETEVATRLQEHTRAAAEREASLADKFKLVSAQLLDQQSQKLSDQNANHLGTLLNPLREQLGEFRKRIDEDSRERHVLQSEIEKLRNLNLNIGEEARNLTRALKGESRTQGAWGELVLERLLEASGLQKGREYETQVTFQDADGGRPRPDVIVHLPEGRDLIVDAKVSLTAYERYCAATDDSERAEQLTAHINSLRTHVKQLAERRYGDLPGINSLEFVLMFVPVEAAYIEAVHHDDALHAFALEKQIVIVTTSTLLATLRTVSSLWRFDDRNRNALDIADRAGKLYDKFTGFVEDIDEARHRLDAARDALAAAGNKLVAGRGNLVGQVEKLRELGARASKQLPEGMVERAQTEEVQMRLDSPEEKS